MPNAFEALHIAIAEFYLTELIESDKWFFQSSNITLIWDLDYYGKAYTNAPHATQAESLTGQLISLKQSIKL